MHGNGTGNGTAGLTTSSAYDHLTRYLSPAGFAALEARSMGTVEAVAADDRRAGLAAARLLGPFAAIAEARRRRAAAAFDRRTPGRQVW